MHTLLLSVAVLLLLCFESVFVCANGGNTTRRTLFEAYSYTTLSTYFSKNYQVFVNSYHLPSLAEAGGVIFAVTEARYASYTGNYAGEIVAKYSTDQGMTWETTVAIPRTIKNTYARTVLPTIVPQNEKLRIFAEKFETWSSDWTDYKSGNGDFVHSLSYMLKYIKDNKVNNEIGFDWPISLIPELSNEMKLLQIKRLVGGHGRGIEVNGTSIVPVWYINTKKEMRPTILLSGSPNWRLAKGTGDAGSVESAVVEWEGKILMNARANDGYRKVYESADMGDTWKEALGSLSRVWGNSPNRRGYGCSASFITVNIENTTVMLFSYPLNIKGRRHQDQLHLWLTDNKRIYDVGQISARGENTGHSSLLYTNGNLYCLYEKERYGDTWYYSSVLAHLVDELKKIKDVVKKWNKQDKAFSESCEGKDKNPSYPGSTCKVHIPQKGLVGFLSGEVIQDKWKDAYSCVDAEITGGVSVKNGMKFNSNGAGAMWPVGKQGQNQRYHFMNHEFTLAATVIIHESIATNTTSLMSVVLDTKDHKKIIDGGHIITGNSSIKEHELKEGLATLANDKAVRIALTFQNGTAKLYLEGKFIKSQAHTFTSGLLYTPISYICILQCGKSNLNAHAHVTVQNVLLYNRVLSNEEMDLLYLPIILTNTPTISKTNSHTNSLSKTLSITETPSRSLSHTTTQSLSHTLSQSQSLSHTLSESQSLSHTLSDSQSLSHTLSESQSLSHTLSESQSLSHTLSESQSLSHTLSESQSLSHTLSDSQSLSHTLSESQSLSHTLSDSQSLSHTLSQSQSLSHTLSESQSLSHTLSDSQSLSHTLSDSQSLSHTLSESQSLSHTLSDSQSLSHTLSESQSLSQTASKSQSLSQTASKSQSLSHTVSESQSLSHTLSDSQSLSYTLSQSQSLSHTLSDSQSLSHTLSESQSLSHTLSQSQSLSHTLSDSQSLSHTLSESQSLSQTASKSQSLSHTLSESQSLSHTLSDSQSLSHTLSESQSLSQTASKSQSLSHTVSESQSLSHTYVAIERGSGKGMKRDASFKREQDMYSDSQPGSLVSTQNPLHTSDRVCPLIVVETFPAGDLTQKDIDGSNNGKRILLVSLPTKVYWPNYDSAGSLLSFLGVSGADQPNGFSGKWGEMLRNAKWRRNTTNPHSVLKAEIPTYSNYNIDSDEEILISVDAKALSVDCQGPLRGSFTIHAEKTSKIAKTSKVVNSVIAGMTAVTVFGAGGVGSILEIQALSLLSRMNCALKEERHGFNLLPYFTSIFVHFGSLWIVLGNALIVVIFGSIHYGVTVLYKQKRGGDSPKAWSRMFFPSFTYFVAYIMHIGIFVHSVSLLFIIKAEWHYYVVGIAGTSYGLIFPLFVIYYVAHYIEVQFVPYTHFINQSCFKRWISPHGYWTPRNQVKMYGSIFFTLKNKYLYWCVFHLSIVSIAGIVTVIPTSTNNCHMQYFCLMGIFLFGSIVTAVANMMRSVFLTSMHTLSFFLLATLCCIGGLNYVLPNMMFFNAYFLFTVMLLIVVFITLLYNACLLFYDWMYVINNAIESIAMKEPFTQGKFEKDLTKGNNLPYGKENPWVSMQSENVNKILNEPYCK